MKSLVNDLSQPSSAKKNRTIQLLARAQNGKGLLSERGVSLGRDYDVLRSFWLLALCVTAVMGITLWARVERQIVSCLNCASLVMLHCWGHNRTLCWKWSKLDQVQPDSKVFQVVVLTVAGIVLVPSTESCDFKQCWWDTHCRGQT